jgi:hypothetical protein
MNSFNFIAILFTLIFFVTSCNFGRVNNEVNNSGQVKDEVILRIGDDDNMDKVLFNYIKNNNYVSVYKFHEQVFENANYVWKDFWIINDFSKEEYDEMKSYATYEDYFEKQMVNSSTARKYTWKRLK